MEIWKDIEGYEGMYQVSDLGNVRSVDRINNKGKRNRGVFLKQQVNIRTGYMQVSLCRNGSRKRKAVHRLVAQAFVDNPDGLATVNHKNENKRDNRADNLEWMSLQDNLAYGTHTQRATANKPDQSGDKHPNFGKRGADALTHKGRVIGTSKNDPNDVVEFDTAATAARMLGLSSGRLCEAINGKAKSCGGYYWRRING